MSNIEKIKKRKDYFREYRILNFDRIRTQMQLSSHRSYLRNKEKMATEYLAIKDTQEYKDRKNSQRRRYMEKWKSKAFELLGGKCLRCNYSDVRALQIDHINSDGYLENRKRNATHYKKVVKSALANELRYQLLCANCNWIKKFENNENAYYPCRLAQTDTPVSTL